MRVLICLLLTLCCCTSFSQVKHVWLTAAMDGRHLLGGTDSTNIWGFGYDSLGVITLPAPLIEVDLGDSVHVHMINEGPESHTIHLHGLDVDQVNDGVPATSFFVLDGDTGTYRFTADQAGTFLYHCHVTTTWHLTMGMYGMLVVNAPDQELYPNGPGFHKKYEFLFSDLEIETNDDPLNAFPFHEIFPDYFMINGKSDSLLVADPNQHVYHEPGDDLLLRLGSMAYSKVVVRFPQGTNPVTHMSDGRALPSPYQTSDLEIYPGERFSVILSPDTAFDGEIEVDFYNMIDGQFLSTNRIPIEGWAVGMDSPDRMKENLLMVYPNPNNGLFTIQIFDSSEELFISDAQGRLVEKIATDSAISYLDLRHLPKGVYLLLTDTGLSGQLLLR